MSICLQIHEEENADKMQDVLNNTQKLTNQVRFWYLYYHSHNSFLSCFYDTSSSIWSEAYSVWHHQHFCACELEWNCFHENVRQILKNQSYTEAEQDFIWITMIINLMTAEAKKDFARSKF